MLYKLKINSVESRIESMFQSILAKDSENEKIEYISGEYSSKFAQVIENIEKKNMEKELILCIVVFTIAGCIV